MKKVLLNLSLIVLVIFVSIGCKRTPIYSTTNTTIDSTEVDISFVVTEDQLNQLEPGGSIVTDDGNTIKKTESGNLEISGTKKVPQKKETHTLVVPTKQVDKSKTIINENSNNKTVDKSKENIGNKDKSRENSGNKDSSRINSDNIKKKSSFPWYLIIIAAALFFITKFRLWRLL